MAARADVCAVASPCDPNSVLNVSCYCRCSTEVSLCKCSGNAQIGRLASITVIWRNHQWKHQPWRSYGNLACYVVWAAELRSGVQLQAGESSPENAVTEPGSAVSGQVSVPSYRLTRRHQLSHPFYWQTHARWTAKWSI